MPKLKFPQALKLTCFPVEKIWGGRFLSQVKKLGNKKIGETWELSTLPEGASLYQDQTLPDFVGSFTDYFWGAEKECQFLIKFIDTQDDLSVQVHPDDAFAKKFENSLGKTECWIVLGAEEGAGVYLGLKENITREGLAQKIRAGENLSEGLIFYPVQKGDFFYVPAGTAHAIGKGVFLLEVQQSSGITYRLWDWNRKDDLGRPRELHVEKGLQVVNDHPEANTRSFFKIQNKVFSGEGLSPLVTHPQFQVSTISLKAQERKGLSLRDRNRACALVCTQGKVEVLRMGELFLLEEWETLLLPFTGGDAVELRPLEDCHLVLVK